MTPHITCDILVLLKGGKIKKVTLKEFRTKKGLTQQEIANLVGITKSMYEKLESGERNPSKETMLKFKNTFSDFDINIFLK